MRTQPASQGIPGLVRRVLGEYKEMPGLALSVSQAQRLWCLERLVVERLLAELVDRGELRQLSDGRFVRSDSNR